MIDDVDCEAVLIVLFPFYDVENLAGCNRFYYSKLIEVSLRLNIILYIDLTFPFV